MGRLGKTEAALIGRRGGNARSRNLSPELRSELASWSQLVREQKRRGETTVVEQRLRLLHLVQAEDPDLAALLKFLSRVSARRAAQIYFALPEQQRELVERKLDEVLTQP